jgi:hypothetical protein
MTPGWAVAVALALVIEVPVVVLFFPGQRAKMAAVAAVANVATNLTLNLVLPHISWLHGRWVLPGEILAVVVEAAAYAVASRPHDLARSLLVSSLGNALSFGVGLLPFVQTVLRAGF